MLKPERHVVWTLAIIGMFAAMYAVAFLLLYPRVAFAGAPFAAAVVMIGGWRFGLRGSVASIFLLSLEGTTLFRIAGSNGWASVFHEMSLTGAVTIVVVGIAIGRMSDLDRKVKSYAQRLQHQAFHDPLTGLPNRALFSDRLEHATARTARGAGSLAVLFVDLDDFKRVNDRHGHATGDVLLKSFAKRLQESLRLGDTVARIGGDEFVALLEDLDDLDSARLAASRLAQAVTRPFVIDDQLYKVSASIGVAYCPAGFTRSADLLREADRAMYEAKATGSGLYQVAQSLVA